MLTQTWVVESVLNLSTRTQSACGVQLSAVSVHLLKVLFEKIFQAQQMHRTLD